MYDWVENGLLTSGKGFEILSSLWFLIYKLSPENTQLGNMCDILKTVMVGQ